MYVIMNICGCDMYIVVQYFYYYNFIRALQLKRSVGHLHGPTVCLKI